MVAAGRFLLLAASASANLCPYADRAECSGVDNPFCSSHPRCIYEGHTGEDGHRNRCCPDRHGTHHQCCGWRGDDMVYDEEPFLDEDFPADPSALQIASLERPELMGGGVEWIRALNLNSHATDQMFTTITPNDPKQGAIGDCWLVSCLSSAASHPAVIQNLFSDDAISSQGKYHVQLWDVSLGARGEFVNIKVDDLIPCRPRLNASAPAQPLFTSNHHNGDLWPMIVEKAFAKFVGSYGHLVAGKSIWGWQALGACQAVYVYQPHLAPGGGKGAGKMGKMGMGGGAATPNQWAIFTNNIQAQRDAMKREREAGNEGWQRTMGPLRASRDGGHALVTVDELFEHFDSMSKHGILAEVSCCQADSGIPTVTRDAIHEFGIINGHAYSLLNVRRFQLSSGEVRLVRIRNPWGNGVVWKGDWGPHSDKWQEYPEMEQRVRDVLGEDRHKGNDGIFWMSLEDFARIFREVEECVLTQDADMLWDGIVHEEL